MGGLRMIRQIKWTSIVMLAWVAWPIQAAQDDLYNFLWLDADKKVYVLQNKVYEKKGTGYFNLGYIADISSNYENLNGYQGAFGYFFSENWGLELFLSPLSRRIQHGCEEPKKS